MPVTVASEWLNSCSGCEISLVDLGERLLDVLQRVDFVHIPVLFDHKYFGQTGEKQHLDIPEADVGIISGGIRNEEHAEIAAHMRSRCKMIIALGTCATHGGIPALANGFPVQDLLERCFTTETTDENPRMFEPPVPPLLDVCSALDEHIAVDVYLPGCPPHPDQLFAALTALLDGKTPELPTKSVCDTCPTVREGKGKLTKLRRFLQNPHYQSPDEPLDRMRCLLEQGFLCMGPVTKAGCGGDAKTPRCIAARVPCRGCYGPVRHDGNPMLDMLNALASNGIDVKSLPEFSSLLRFAGAHRLLRPSRPRNERRVSP